MSSQFILWQKFIQRFSWRERLFRNLFLSSILQVSFYSSLSRLKMDHHIKRVAAGLKDQVATHRRVEPKCSKWFPSDIGIKSRLLVVADKSKHHQDDMPRDLLEAVNGNFTEQYGDVDSDGEKDAEFIVTRGTKLPEFLLKWAHYYHTFAMVFYAYMFCHHLLIYLLNFKFLSELRQLDCYLAGRFILSSRVLDGSKIFAMVMCIHQLVGRTIYSRAKLTKSFELICAEFMLYRYDEVCALELTLGDHQLADGQHERFLTGQHGPVSHDSSINSHREETSTSTCLYNSTISLGNELNSGGDHQSHRAPILRPNRGAASWNVLIDFTLYFLTSSYLAMATLFLGLGFLFFPVIATKRGFELNYANCVDWITRQPEPGQFGHIYRVFDGHQGTSQQTPANRSRHQQHFEPNRQRGQLLLPYEDFQPMSFYNLIRILVDICLNLFCWLDFYQLVINQLLLMFLPVLDVGLYNSKLSKMLQKLVYKMQQSRCLRITSSIGPFQTRRELDRGIQSRLKQRAPLRSVGPNFEFEIYNIQSIIIDYFKLIAKYNSFINSMAVFNIFLWLIYTSIISATFLLPSMSSGGQQIEGRLEFGALFGGATFQITCVVGSAAVIRVMSRNLYQQMVALMALDENVHTTKAHWPIIIKFYHPKALFCFTLFNKFEISWRLYLKLVSWVVSALIVAASLYDYR